MSTKPYDDMTVRELQDACRDRKISMPRNAPKAALVELLRAADDQVRDPADFGDLPPPAEAPDEHVPPPPKPPKPQPTVKIPPDYATDGIDPGALPQEPERRKLTNDIKIYPKGLPVTLKAGSVLSARDYDFDMIKACGGCLIPEHIGAKKG